MYIISNLFTILFVLMIIGTILVIILGLLKYFTPRTEAFAYLVSEHFSMHSKYLRILIPIIEFITLTAIFLYPILILFGINNLNQSSGEMLITESGLFIFGSIVIIFLGSLNTELKKIAFSHYFILPRWFKTIISRCFKTSSWSFIDRIYIFNRFKIWIYQIQEFMFVFLVFYLSLSFFTYLKWDINTFFLSFSLIPVLGNYWVYYTSFFNLNRDQEAVFIRRVFMYFLILLISTVGIYLEYKNVLQSSKTLSSFELFWMTSSVGLYLASDRILKEVVSDYLKFKEKKAIN